MVKKILFLIICCISVTYCFSQSKQVQLIQSDSLTGIQSGFLRVIKPVFTHEGASLAADSANFNQQLNAFDAFGHVVITQSDGTTIYSDLLNYNGNSRIAVLTNNVRLRDRDALLTTNYLTYNLATKIGTYTNEGKINNGKDTLSSKTGYYFSSTRDAYFRHNVVINSKDAMIKSDTLRYNSGSKIAYLYGPTHIYGKNDTLYTENGQYNTETDQANFWKSNRYTQGSKSLVGDSLFYDRKAGFGRATGNILFQDTTDNVSLRGQLAVYKSVDESILITKTPYVVIVTKDSLKLDSIWITADTLFSKKVLKSELKLTKKPVLKKDSELSDLDEEVKEVSLADTMKLSAKNSSIDLKDSIAESKLDTSTIRVMSFYRNVKIFKSDLQARADSVFYSYSDSTIRCYNAPMIWTQGNQLSADTIYMELKNREMDNMLLHRNGLIVSTDGDSTKFNQVKGKMITGLFKDDKLSKMFIDGNAESIFYMKDSTSYIGMNRSMSLRIEITLDDNKPAKTNFKNTVDMHIFPIDKIPRDMDVLKGFSWKPKDRPKSKDEIIPSSINAAPSIAPATKATDAISNIRKS